MPKYIILLLPVSLLFSGCTIRTPSKINFTSANILQLKELNSKQITALDKTKTVVLIPGGIMEEHGPYLPSYTDGYWNERLTDSIANAITTKPGWKAVLFPTIPLGNNGANDIGEKYSFPGSYTVRMETLRAIFMDLATELGEQGFKYVLIIHGHGAPNHNMALDQAAQYFNETYGGRMINLVGLLPVFTQWGIATKTPAQEKEDGFTVHAGMDEASSMLFLKPELVDTGYKQAPSFTGSSMANLRSIAHAPHWTGYFGAEHLSNAAYGKEAWDNNTKAFSRLVLDILDNKVDPDSIPRFADVAVQDTAIAVVDSLSLVHEKGIKEKENAWLKKRGFE